MSIKKSLLTIILSVILGIFLLLFIFVDLTAVVEYLITVIPEHVKNNFNLFKQIFIPSLVFTLLFFLIVNYLQNKYSIKVEQLSLGGINILFDRRKTLFKNSIRNFLDTKRTLFQIDERYDNFAEVFQSYYETYHFIRQEMRILEPKKDVNLYQIANKILINLNQFLTKNQNNYLRWYQHISETNQELIKLDEFDEKDIKAEQRHFYNMPINEIQSKYYLYSKLVQEFKTINQFFVNHIAKEFNVDIAKWEQKDFD